MPDGIVRIESDGVSHGTAVTVNGHPVRCQRIEWSINVGELAQAVIYVDLAEAVLEAQNVTIIQQPVLGQRKEQ